MPVVVLVGFAPWTLLTLLGSVGVYRWSRILTGHASIAEWRADWPQGCEWYQRAMRAHMNCVENLPVYTAIVVALMAIGGPWSQFDPTQALGPAAIRTRSPDERSCAALAKHC